MTAIIIAAVHIQLRADANTALGELYREISNLQNWYPDSVPVTGHSGLLISQPQAMDEPGHPQQTKSTAHSV